MITLFSKPNCKPCMELKMWFKNKQIEYQEQDLYANLDNLISMGFQSAPVVLINDTYIAGNNISNVREALNRNGYTVS